MVVTYVVVSTFKFDKLICFLLYTVDVEVTVFFIRTVEDFHLTVCTKCEVTGEERCSFKKFFFDKYSLIYEVLMVVTYVVVSTFEFDKLICFLLYTVEVEVTVFFVRTVENFHLTVCTEREVTGEERCTFEKCFFYKHSLVYKVLIIVTDIVVSTLKFDKLICSLLYSVNIEVTVFFIRTVENYHLTVSAEREVTCLERCSLEESFLNENSLIYKILVVVTYVIVSTFEFNYLICLLSYTVNVEVTVFCRALKQCCNTIGCTVIVNEAS